MQTKLIQPVTDLSTQSSGAGAQLVTVSGRRASVSFKCDDWLANEVPIALEFNGVSHAVMLATPLDLEDFALGFALSESILENSNQLFDTDIVAASNGITVQMNIANSAFSKLKDKRRTMTGRTGCGLCGTENLAQVVRQLPPLADTGKSVGVFNATQICNAIKSLQAAQPLQNATGSVHAAAWCDANATLQIVREDVGRHNALDKVIGALAKIKQFNAATGFFIVTSRASFEMVQKTVSAGVPLLAAVSGATSFAVQSAQRANLSLLGFVRDDDLVVYSHPQRIEI
jgi:FdhD protein